MLSQAVEELENRLLKLNNVSYYSIDRLMRKIMKSYDVTAKELHNAFKQKNKKTPDDWIKEKMKKIHEDHKEIDSGEKVDDEGYMARNELDSIEKSIQSLRKSIKSGKQQLPAWVQSKITKASDYIDTAAEYLESDEKVDEGVNLNSLKIDPKEIKKGARDKKIRTIAQQGSTPGEQKAAQNKRRGPSIPLVKPGDTDIRNINAEYEPSLVEKILGEEKCGKGMYWCNTEKKCKPLQGLKVPGQKVEPTETGIGKPVAEDSCTHTKKGKSCPVHGMDECPSCNESAYVELINLISAGSIEEENPCWKGYTQVGMKTKNSKEVPNCVPVKKGVKKAKGYKKESVDEAVRISAQTGNNIFVTLSWRGKYYTIQIFFPQAKIPSRLEITDEIQKIYPGSRVVTYRVAELKQGEPLIYAYKGGDGGKLGSNKNYVKPMGEEREIEPPREKVGALTNIDIPQSEREAARQRTLVKAAAKRKEREMKEEIEIEEGILSDIADKIKGRKVIGRTGSGGKIYAPTKRKSSSSSVTYDGKTQDEIRKEKKQKEVDANRIKKVKKGQYDDPWLRSSPAAERRLHYQQLRGEGVEILEVKK
jgi:hypothetical protein